jgi:hypothetical protein
VREIVQRIEEDDRRFAAVARISDINLGMYRSFLRPWIQAGVTPQSAEWAQRLHPLRLPYELISDRNPAIAPIAKVADQVREHREPVASDNPFLVAQQMMSQAIVAGLEIFTELRDAAVERSFMNIYGSPLVQDWAGLGARPNPYTALFSSWPSIPGLPADTLRALPGPALLHAAYAYGVDAWQRGVLYADVMRQRGNQYLVHMAKREPNVLVMASEVLLDGREFERPVNYMLLRIVPPADTPADPEKRPFLVVDPRAGHGPGIGGFKPESEIPSPASRC